MKAMIESVRRSVMGTASIEAKFKGMRKSQNFNVYPITSEADAKKITIQSGTRIGYYIPETKTIKLCKPCSSGAYFHHLSYAEAMGEWVISELSDEDNEKLITGIRATTGDLVGGFIKCENSFASAV